LYLELTDELEQSGGFRNSGRQTYGVLQKVNSTKDTKSTVDLTYDRVAISTSVPQPLDYDSDRPEQSREAAALDPVFSAMVGKTISIEIGPDGRAAAIAGHEKMLEAIDRRAGPTPQWTSLRPMMTAGVFKVQFWDKPHVLYPNREVKVADKWSTSLDAALPVVGMVKYEYECELKEIVSRDGRDVARVEFTGRIVMPAQPGEVLPAGPMKLRIESGKMSGTALFDVELGEFVSQSHETELVIAGTLPSSSPASQPATLSIAQKSKALLRVMPPEERARQKRENAAKSGPASQPATAPAGQKPQD
jgi:hypothetical protein